MSIDDQLNALRDATRSLVRAAESGDAELVERTIAARGVAVESLVSHVVELPTRERSDFLGKIAADADDAETALARLAGASREALELLRRRVGAVRGYGTGPDGTPSSLDRAT